MTAIVAVSGGVDSVVLLHMFSRGRFRADEIIVAHFDHGIRPESDVDARFVSNLAKLYGLRCEVRREELGPDASELEARDRRYVFLREMSQQYKATIFTAHHADDVVETVAINLKRGTGWRGLAVLDSPNLERPLTNLTKAQIYQYALDHRLEWVEDETNQTDAYLRNRLRRVLHRELSSEAQVSVLDLWTDQKRLRKLIDSEVERYIHEEGRYSRYFFSHIDEKVAHELLRNITKAAMTRPQLDRILHAIKTVRHGAVIDAGGGIKFRFTTREFIVQIPQ